MYFDPTFTLVTFSRPFEKKTDQRPLYFDGVQIRTNQYRQRYRSIINSILGGGSDVAQYVKALESATLVPGLIPHEQLPLISDFELWDCSADSYMQRQAAYSPFHLGIRIRTTRAKSARPAYQLKMYRLKRLPNPSCTGSQQKVTRMSICSDQ